MKRLLLSLLLAVPVYAQTPAVPVVDEHPVPEATPTPAPKIWTADVEAGPSTVSILTDIKPYARARVTVDGAPWKSWHVGLRGDLDRSQDGNAQTVQQLSAFVGMEAGIYARYRIGDSPVSVGGVGAVTWALEDPTRTPKYARLWTGEGILCVERFKWWPDGGIACVGTGWRGPVGGGAVSFSAIIPIKDVVSTAIDVDIPWTKIPETILALQTPPAGLSPDELRAYGQRLPVTVKVAILVRLKRFAF